MEYMHYYSQEKVDQYLQAIQDGKIDPKEAAEKHRAMYNGLDSNPYYLANYLALDCHTQMGTGLILIMPDDRVGMKNGTI